jgi:hypothetical protein
LKAREIEHSLARRRRGRKEGKDDLNKYRGTKGKEITHPPTLP